MPAGVCGGIRWNSLIVASVSSCRLDSSGYSTGRLGQGQGFAHQLFGTPGVAHALEVQRHGLAHGGAGGLVTHCSARP
jgi:hypothetical protein